MLVSSKQAMFIDPSMKHLLDLPPDKNHQLMDLTKLQYVLGYGCMGLR